MTSARDELQIRCDNYMKEIQVNILTVLLQLISLS